MFRHLCTFTTDTRAPVQFDYTNHRDEPHTYTGLIESATISQEFNHHDDPGVPEFMLHIQVITRDGDTRPEMGPTRRRSFKVNGMTNFRVL